MRAPATSLREVMLALLLLLVGPNDVVGNEVACLRDPPASWTSLRSMHGELGLLEPHTFFMSTSHCCVVDPRAEREGRGE